MAIKYKDVGRLHFTGDTSIEVWKLQDPDSVMLDVYDMNQFIPLLLTREEAGDLIDTLQRALKLK